MNVFTTLDDRFVRLADDDEQRAVALGRLRAGRVVCYLGGLVFCAMALSVILSGQGKGWGFALFGVLCFGIAFKNESDIRTLRMVEHLRKGCGR